MKWCYNLQQNWTLELKRKSFLQLIHIVTIDWPCPYYLKKKLKKDTPSKWKHHYCLARLNWPTDCRSSSQITEEESSKKLNAISLYQGLHFSLLGCKTTTRTQANTILYTVLNNTHEIDHIMQPCLNVCITSVKYR